MGPRVPEGGDGLGLCDVRESKQLLGTGVKEECSAAIVVPGDEADEIILAGGGRVNHKAIFWN